MTDGAATFILGEGERRDVTRSRRRFLTGVAGVAAAAVSAGCGGGQRVTPAPVQETPTDADGETAPRTASATPTDTATPTDAPTETAATPTRTPMPAPVPPNGSLSLVSEGVQSVRRGNDYTYVDCYVALENTGVADVTFVTIELRFDVYFTTIGGERRHVGAGYATESFDEEDGFTPGETRTITCRVSFPPDGRANNSYDRSQYSTEFAYRRVLYR